ncbi:unnamed protein product [Rotaria sordida]|uniref:Uncharacterized protein n=1 Tax=Rotaria sordida TaxID=392033 RepID=A0A814L0T5_9BILA|nr:unnamed protein product [Rotaria sordida]CAF1106001.1 unnamed protein product [Rotaria sordida]CAF1313605.1 unnamed protein product [Rotaria sordida]CAF1314251.1 unnamed protein product [Rotaria sordida]CAF1339465.1 unnamed protein product [Rotaria sordida]
MPSFKERFRPSRKYKKNKETSSLNTDDSASSTNASGISTNITTAGASTTIDDHTGLVSLSTYSTHYSVDYYKINPKD